MRHSVGQKLVELYHEIGKPVAIYIEAHAWLKPLARLSLYPVIGLVWLIISTNTVAKGFIVLCVLTGSLIAVRIYKTRRKIFGVD